MSSDLIKSADNTFKVALPSTPEIADFFAKIKESCLLPPKSFAAEAQNILKPSFYIEAKKPQKILTQEEIDLVEQKEESTMRTLRIFLRNCVTMLAKDQRFKEFVG